MSRTTIGLPVVHFDIKVATGQMPLTGETPDSVTPHPGKI